ncbi:MAG TPA: YciI family protein [Xanthomonadales bacterium]|nr:YciI family protein [Xanthomonadales bacterium]
MWYSIYGRDVSDSLERRMSVREAHLARVRALLEEGRLMVAGPRPAIDSPDPGPAGWQGSLIIAKFESLEAAEAWAQDDPYIHSGAYEKVEVSPFIPILP